MYAFVVLHSHEEVPCDTVTIVSATRLEFLSSTAPRAVNTNIVFQKLPRTSSRGVTKANRGREPVTLTANKDFGVEGALSAPTNSH